MYMWGRLPRGGFPLADALIRKSPGKDKNDQGVGDESEMLSERQQIKPCGESQAQPVPRPNGGAGQRAQGQSCFQSIGSNLRHSVFTGGANLSKFSAFSLLWIGK